MLYFNHSEIARKFHISRRTVHNWIEATKSGKIDLTLHNENGTVYIANTAHNVSIIQGLSQSGRKYRNTKATKIITPKAEFYEVYNEHQIYDITTDIEIHHEIPRQYNYFNGGAEGWDKYAERLARDETPNLVNSTTKLLRSNQGYIDELISDFKCVNVIDVGVGNAYPVKELLAHLLEQGKLGRYVALDISKDILEIARENIDHWFKGKIAFEGYEFDINYDRFSDLLIREYAKEDAEDTINLVLLLGGTLSNMRTPDAGYKIIHDSMGINDLLIHTTKLDTEATRRYFDFDLSPGETRLAPIHSLTVELLNIDPSLYEVEMGYDATRKQRFERIRLNVSLTIKFKFKDGERSIYLNKGDTLLTWRGLQQTAGDVNDQFDRNEFYLLHSSQTNDQEYILTVSRVKCD